MVDAERERRAAGHGTARDRLRELMREHVVAGWPLDQGSGSICSSPRTSRRDSRSRGRLQGGLVEGGQAGQGSKEMEEAGVGRGQLIGAELIGAGALFRSTYVV